MENVSVGNEHFGDGRDGKYLDGERGDGKRVLMIVVDEISLDLAVMTSERQGEVLLEIGLHQYRCHEKLMELAAHRLPKLRR